MNRFMQLAIEEAHKGVMQNDGGPFGAVIVKDDVVIAQAHNSVLHTKDPTAHAEMLAIQHASKKLDSFDLSGCDIYTTCMPCPMCMGALQWANVRTIYYGATSLDAEKAGFRDKQFHEEEQNQPLIELGREASLEVFKLWNAKEDKIIY
ncbi:MAG: nucleoside deaminase [Sulfurimonadaceae bacterium]|jgi:guanine deaminase|nr:nucleoside deaminase [Sulfurimonadaceae bacterium]